MRAEVSKDLDAQLEKTTFKQAKEREISFEPKYVQKGKELDLEL